MLENMLLAFLFSLASLLTLLGHYRKQLRVIF